MSFEDRGLYIDLLALAWDSDEPGSIVLPIPGYNPRTIRSFLLRWPLTFVSTGAERDPNVTPTEAERRLKSGRKEAERYLKFTNAKLREQYLNLKDISEKRRLAAESRYRANAPANAPANDQSASASSSASAFAVSSNNTVSQDAVVAVVDTANGNGHKPRATTPSAAMVRAFRALGHKPFGPPRFQEIWLEQYNQAGEDPNWTDIMEMTIQLCDEVKVTVPRVFYKHKTQIEDAEIKMRYKVTPL
jgi:hypothetical protein